MLFEFAPIVPLFPLEKPCDEFWCCLYELFWWWCRPLPVVIDWLIRPLLLASWDETWLPCMCFGAEPGRLEPPDTILVFMLCVLCIFFWLPEPLWCVDPEWPTVEAAVPLVWLLDD